MTTKVTLVAVEKQPTIELNPINSHSHRVKLILPEFVFLPAVVGMSQVSWQYFHFLLDACVCFSSSRFFVLFS